MAVTVGMDHVQTMANIIPANKSIGDTSEEKAQPKVQYNRPTHAAPEIFHMQASCWGHVTSLPRGVLQRWNDIWWSVHLVKYGGFWISTASKLSRCIFGRKLWGIFLSVAASCNLGVNYTLWLRNHLWIIDSRKIDLSNGSAMFTGLRRASIA